MLTKNESWTPELKYYLIKAMRTLGIEPWLGFADWGLAAEAMSSITGERWSPARARSQYRTLNRNLESLGMEIEEFIERGDDLFEWYSEWVDQIIDVEKYGNTTTSTMTVLESHEEDETDIEQGLIEEYIKRARIDTEKYDVEIKSMWGNPLQASFKVVPRRESPEEVLEQAQEYLNNIKPVEPLEPPDDMYKAFAVLGIVDVHTGKRSLGGEAQPDFKYHVDNLFEQMIPISHGILPLGHDWFNTDTRDEKTASGTPQDNSMSWLNMIETGLDHAVYAMERALEYVQNLHIELVLGNHSPLMELWLYTALKQRYRNEPRVTFNRESGYVSFYAWEEVGLMLAHGEMSRKDIMPTLYSQGRVKLANASTTQVFSGHIHTKQDWLMPMEEVKGVWLHYLPALTGSDDWHLRKTYLGNRPCASAWIYRPDGSLARTLYG